MRLMPASRSLGALLSAGCGLVGYNFEGYGPAGTSVGGVGGGVTASAASVAWGEVGGGKASTIAVPGTGGAGSCTGFAPGGDTIVLHASKFLLVGDLAGSTGVTRTDKLPDVVVTSDVALTTSVLYNKGNGKLDATIGPSSAAIGAASISAFGDMNADGLPDLVQLSAATGKVSYAFNMGNKFRDWVSLNLAPSLAPGAVTSSPPRPGRIRYRC
jgi:FG-GAP-like repeat